MIGHQARLQENHDLLLWRAPAIKKKPPVFNVRALVAREIMRSKNELSCYFFSIFSAPTIAFLVL